MRAEFRPSHGDVGSLKRGKQTLFLFHKNFVSVLQLDRNPNYRKKKIRKTITLKPYRYLIY